MNASINEKTTEFAREELAGKLLAVCVGQLEKLRTPWNMTSEVNQGVALNAMRDAVEKAVRAAVLVIATDRRPSLRATVESVTFKDGIKAVLSVDRNNAMRHDLADAEGSTIIVTIAHPETYAAGAEKVTASLDQPSLPLDGDPDPILAPPPEPLPEIRKEEDDSYTIYKGDKPVVGGKGFIRHSDAEVWLQKLLVVEMKKRPAAEDEPPAFTIEPPPQAQNGEMDLPPPTGETTGAAPGPSAFAFDLNNAVTAFKQAGLDEAKKGVQGDWDRAFALITAKYSSEFVEEFFTELDSAFADGWEEGTSGS